MAKTKHCQSTALLAWLFWLTVTVINYAWLWNALSILL